MKKVMLKIPRKILNIAFKVIFGLMSVCIVFLLVVVLMQNKTIDDLREENAVAQDRIISLSDLVKRMIPEIEAYISLIIKNESDHREFQEYKENVEMIIALKPLQDYYSDDEIEEIIKEIPHGYIFRNGFHPTAFYGDSIGLHGKYRTDHKGLDGYGKKGDRYITPIASGIVTNSGEDSVYGKYVYVQHSERVRSFYGHGEKIYDRARTGREVGPDDVIMLMGETGMADGKHVHSELQICVNIKEDKWIPVNLYVYLTRGPLESG